MHSDFFFSPPEPSPKSLYASLEQASRGYKTFLALRTAVRFGVFSFLSSGKKLDDLSSDTGIAPCFLEPLCELLEQIGMVCKQDDIWWPTEDAGTYLCASGPYSQVAVLESLVETFSLWEKLESIFQRGPVNPFKEGIFGGAFLPGLAAETLAGEAQRTAALAAAVPDFFKVRDLLDIGGGHGLYSLAFCARFPEMQAEIMDLESARPLAERNIQIFNGSRVRFSPADIFKEPLGKERDAVLLFYNPGGKNPQLLERIHDCLRQGGIFASKHVFYSRGDKGKDPLTDLEWNLTAMPGVEKGPYMYSFSGDLPREDYMAQLGDFFEIVADYGPENFAVPDLAKFGDRQGSRFIIARKR